MVYSKKYQRHLPLHDKETVLLAVAEVKAGKTFSEVSRTYDIARKTIRKYLSWNPEDIPATLLVGSKKTFSAEQENEIREEVKKICKSFNGIPRPLLGCLAAKVARLHNLSTSFNGNAGEEWISNFLERHADIKSIMNPKKTSSKNSVRTFFNELKLKIDEENIPPERIYTLSVASAKIHRITKYVPRTKSYRNQYGLAPCNIGKRITFIACANARGEGFRMAIVFPTSHCPTKSQFSKAPPGLLKLRSEDGALMESSFSGWAKRFCEEEAAQSTGKILLLLKDSNVFKTLQTHQLFEDSSIKLVIMPTSSKDMLPLDKMLKNQFLIELKNTISIWQDENEGLRFLERDVPRVLQHPMSSTFSGSNIRSGFRRTGIWVENVKGPSHPIMAEEISSSDDDEIFRPRFRGATRTIIDSENESGLDIENETSQNIPRKPTGNPQNLQSDRQRSATTVLPLVPYDTSESDGEASVTSEHRDGNAGQSEEEVFGGYIIDGSEEEVRNTGRKRREDENVGFNVGPFELDTEVPVPKKKRRAHQGSQILTSDDYLQELRLREEKKQQVNARKLAAKTNSGKIQKKRN